MTTTLRAWQEGLALEGYSKFAVPSSSPLWLNPTLSHFCMLLKPSAVTKYGISTPKSATPCFCYTNFPQHIMCLLVTYSATYSSPHIHCRPVNFGGGSPNTVCFAKPTSRLYSHLLLVSSQALDWLRAWWQRDIPDLDNDDWEDIWDLPFRSLVSLQFKVAHRAYLTPFRLHKTQSFHPPECWRYGDPLGIFCHIFWSCPAVTGFWADVLGEN